MQPGTKLVLINRKSHLFLTLDRKSNQTSHIQVNVHLKISKQKHSPQVTRSLIYTLTVISQHSVEYSK